MIAVELQDENSILVQFDAPFYMNNALVSGFATEGEDVVDWSQFDIDRVHFQTVPGTPGEFSAYSNNAGIRSASGGLVTPVTVGIPFP